MIIFSLRVYKWLSLEQLKRNSDITHLSNDGQTAPAYLCLLREWCYYLRTDIYSIRWLKGRGSQEETGLLAWRTWRDTLISSTWGFYSSSQRHSYILLVKKDSERKDMFTSLNFFLSFFKCFNGDKHLQRRGVELIWRFSVKTRVQSPICWTHQSHSEETSALLLLISLKWKPFQHLSSQKSFSAQQTRADGDHFHTRLQLLHANWPLLYSRSSLATSAF